MCGYIQIKAAGQTYDYLLLDRVTPLRASGFQEELPFTLYLSLTSHST